MNNNQDLNLRIKTALDAAATEKDLKNLKQLLRELQSLANQVGDSNADAFTQLNTAASEVNDRLQDVRENLNAITGEPLENVSAGFGLVKDGLMNLDFGKATTGINAMATGLGKLSIKDTAKGIKDFAGALGNLGKSLLGNPIFLLGGALVLIIANFEKLTKAGGLVGDFFKGLNVIITAVKDTIMNFVNAIGIVNTKQEDLRLNTIALNTAQSELNKTYLEGLKAVSDFLGYSTLQYEYAEKRIAITDAERESRALLYEELQKRPKLEAVFNASSLEEADYFAKKYNLILNKDQIESLKNYYQKKKELQNFFNLNDAKVLKGIVESEHNREVNRINLIKDTNEREKQLKAENYKFERNIRGIENQKALDDIQTQSWEEFRLAQDDYKSKEKSLSEHLQEVKDLEINHQKAVKDLYKSGGKVMTPQEIKLVNSLKTQLDNAKQLTPFLQSQVESAKTVMEAADERLMGEMEGYDTGFFSKKRVEQDKKQKQDEKNRAILHRRELKKLDLTAQKEALDEELRQLREAADTKLKELDLTARKEGLTVRETETKKKEILRDSYFKTYDIIQEQYDVQIKLAEGNKLKVEALEFDKLNALKNLTLDYTKTVNDSNDKIKEKDEETAKSREKNARDYIDLLIEQNKKVIDFHQNQLDIYNSELTRLDLGEQKYKNNYLQKIDLIKKSFDEQKIILNNQYINEILAAEGKEEEIYKINKKYAELKKRLKAEEGDAILQTEQELTQKQIQEMAAVADSAIAFGNLMDAFDDARRDANGKLDIESQKKAFYRNKELQKGAVLINTAAGVSNALSTQNYAGAIAIGIAGMAQYAKILAVQFNPEGGETSGGSSGGSSGGGSITPPSMATPPSAPLMGQGYLNQNFNPNGINTMGFKPGNDLRVYVLEQDITSLQNRVKVSEKRSLLGNF